MWSKLLANTAIRRNAMKQKLIRSTYGPNLSAFSARSLTASLAAFMLWGGEIQLEARSDIRSDSFTDLTELSLEELTNIRVTSVSKKSQKLSQAPAAIFVITDKEIARSGATSLPEALRMSPGLNVARVSKSIWAISARGFNDQFANKLLVMMDGRSVYTPLFSGVYWDVQDTLLEDIDRIEVIRGPGATLWGANAVNGVINILTKSARDTQGLLASAGGGGEERIFASFRYGGKLRPELHFRVYGKYFERDGSRLASGGTAHDAREFGQGGFRLDWNPGESDRLTLQGDYYKGNGRQVTPQFSLLPPYTAEIPETFDVSGGNILGRWGHRFSSESDLTLQFYFDHTTRDMLVVGEERDTFDIDFQHRFQAGKRHEIVWGGGYRHSKDRLRDSYGVQSLRDARGLDLANAFVQDEITIIPERLALTIGTKLEHNDFTGYEIQPSGRFSWTLKEGHTFWASASRAVRTASRAEHDARLITSVIPPSPFNPLATLLTIEGDTDFGSEVLNAYELGYRLQPGSRVTIDLAGFYNRYQSLRGINASSPLVNFVPLPHVVLPLTFANNMSGHTHGVELTGTWQATDRWRIQANYSYLEIVLNSPSNDMSPDATQTEGESPEHQFSLRSYVDLPKRMKFYAGLRYVSTLPNLIIDRYTELDLRLGWRPNKTFELAIVGQNLLHGAHAEFPGRFFSIQATEVERSIHGKVTLRF